MTYKQTLRWFTTLSKNNRPISRAVCSHGTYEVRRKRPKFWYAYENDRKLWTQHFSSRVLAIAAIEQAYYKKILNRPVEHIDKRGLHNAKELPKGMSCDDLNNKNRQSSIQIDD